MHKGRVRLRQRVAIGGAYRVRQSSGTGKSRTKCRNCCQH